MSLQSDPWWQRFDLGGESTQERKARADKVAAGGGCMFAVLCPTLNHTIVKAFDCQLNFPMLAKDLTLEFEEFDRKEHNNKFLKKNHLSYISLSGLLIPAGSTVESLSYVVAASAPLLFFL
eukprot:TRINITY_DN3759_c0_g1_i2.p1 TRINITY_DN3759_c0_g1~~TRINITY_DN3759_c0_g1_i2.p1  ORF type:complete len:121 (+),score=17.30 TRINITY_DN3759_c0_g1_i2:57-419(+)